MASGEGGPLQAALKGLESPHTWIVSNLNLAWRLQPPGVPAMVTRARGAVPFLLRFQQSMEGLSKQKHVPPRPQVPGEGAPCGSPA